MMFEREIVLNLREIYNRRHEIKLERLRSGLPLKRKRNLPKDPEKRKAVLEWLLRVTPPAEDILSGRAFSERLGKS